ncbi:hypothetical protein E2C01_081645 [Portunus trituberculatus]|uniref:Uncharacterized protein n=1 Tax=Portunus trituberculatus TaxID=210409 RepID=A0A5B7IX45_PORTR|nr:hypothetical protein [Portunus trituberculatus]
MKALIKRISLHLRTNQTHPNSAISYDTPITHTRNPSSETYAIPRFSCTSEYLPVSVKLRLFLAQVSWVRHHDIHVLTVGRFTFTNDDRFEVHHDDGSNEWLLRLR